MPDHPFPYVMRDWKSVARGYDSLVFNASLSGTYLPLVATSPAFGLSSYVGELPSQSREAINCIPAVIGATLVGADKSNQFGKNWAQLCQQWYNANPQQGVYLNNPGGTSGQDWWYDLMPNVFFYELYSLYPGADGFQSQSTAVANRWLEALMAMGASTAPWGLANLGHTAWNLATMTPTNAGWTEPEAGGSIAWILYMAFVKTGDTRFRIGAELAMESLLVYPVAQNPSYELQLPYGASLAARMNAELGTTYDVTKLVSWCFSDGSDNSRLWGVTVGAWGGLDCDGLIGETGFGSGNGYPFTMNTFEQIGALLPLVRYDSRFAAAIGKWVLNAANAARLFYTDYLPDSNQDGAAWAHQYDPNSLIAHESMHQFDPANMSISPFATGDAIRNGNPTNFALYGSSHVGLLGSVLDTTDVPMILRLDLLKTDFFHDSAYATCLYYNPDSAQHSVSFDCGSGQRDLYDAVSHAFIVQNASGVIPLPIGPGTAIVVVNAPAGGVVTFDVEKTLVNGVVVDYHSGRTVPDHPPRVKSLAAGSPVLTPGHSTYVYCAAADADNDTLSYRWVVSGGALSGSGATILWTAPDTLGIFTVQCAVTDGHGGEATSTDTLTVVPSINHAPVIKQLKATPRKIDLHGSSSVGCVAADPDSDAVEYRWSARSGAISGPGSTINWQAPGTAGNYFIVCTADDGRGGTAVDSIGIEVRDFSSWPSGSLVAYYPFSGDTKDASGNGHDGTAHGGTFVADRFGSPSSAFGFDGSTASIDIPNDSSLNFQSGITLVFWMTVNAFSTDDRYALSHGSWQNRWKVTVTNEKVRWTVKTTSGVKDLDSETSLLLDSLNNVCVTYNGSDMEIYLNGALDAFTNWTGLLLPTSYDLTMGQDFPGNNTYDFDGVLDDVHIFNYMLPVSQIESFYDLTTSVSGYSAPLLPQHVVLDQSYPNPFNPSCTIKFTIPERLNRTTVRLEVFDRLGRSVATLVNGSLDQGVHTVSWDAGHFPSGVYFYRLSTFEGAQIRKMVLIK